MLATHSTPFWIVVAIVVLVATRALAQRIERMGARATPPVRQRPPEQQAQTIRRLVAHVPTLPPGNDIGVSTVADRAQVDGHDGATLLPARGTARRAALAASAPLAPQPAARTQAPLQPTRPRPPLRPAP